MNPDWEISVEKTIFPDGLKEEVKFWITKSAVGVKWVRLSWLVSYDGARKNENIKDVLYKEFDSDPNSGTLENARLWRSFKFVVTKKTEITTFPLQAVETSVSAQRIIVNDERPWDKKPKGVTDVTYPLNKTDIIPFGNRAKMLLEARIRKVYQHENGYDALAVLLALISFSILVAIVCYKKVKRNQKHKEIV